MSLLVMICNLAHQHDETKQGTMFLVQQYLELALMAQEPGMSCDKFLQLFKVQVNTINVHGERAGYYHELHQQHFDALCIQAFKS